MKDKPFGLDINTTSMKAVWLSEEKEGFALKAAGILPSSSKWMLSEATFDQEEMVRSIKELVDQTKINTRSVNIALSENQVYTKVLEMPPLSDKELASAIYWEAEQYIPVPLTTITLDFRVLKRPDQSQTNGKMEVLLVGAPTVFVDKYQKIMQDVGLAINAIETETLSVTRSLVKAEAVGDGLIVHIGQIATLLAIIKDGTLSFSYSIPTGGAALDRALEQDFGFTPLQVQEYKKTYGMAEKSFGEEIGQITKPVLMTIAIEAKKALAFYAEKYKNNPPIQQVLLSGETAKILGIDEFFTQNCGVLAVSANPWKILTDQNIPQELLENASAYSVAVGLAMRDYE